MPFKKIKNKRKIKTYTHTKTYTYKQNINIKKEIIGTSSVPMVVSALTHAELQTLHKLELNRDMIQGHSVPYLNLLRILSDIAHNPEGI